MLQLETLMDGFLSKIFPDKYWFFSPWCDYLDGFGFYEITDADRGWYDMWYIGEDVNDAFFHRINDILFNISNYYEVHNRNEVEKLYHERFGDIEYYWLLYQKEYSLEKWKTYYDGTLPEELKNYFEDEVNSSWWLKERNIQFEYDGEKFILEKNKMLKL